MLKNPKRMLKRLINALIYEQNEAYWFCRNLSEAVPRVELDLPIEIRLDEPHETIAWLKTFDEPWMYHKKEVRIGLAEGHYFASAKHDGKIIGYSKVAHTRVYVSDYTTVVSLAAATVLLHHIYVIREYRKHNVAKLLLSEWLQELKTKGFARMYSQIAVWNEPSMRLFASVGFQRVAHVKFLKLFGVIRLWLIRREGEHRFRLARTSPIEALSSGRFGQDRIDPVDVRTS
jgi:L-amino acid N-acyltransferase YncA